MTSSPDRLDVILAGVGTSFGGPDLESDRERQLEPIDVMVDATSAALDDTCSALGRGALAQRIDYVAVPEGNWSYPDPARLVAERVGATGATTVRVDIGVPQHTPIRVAAERIAAGEIELAVVVGGEAKATQLRTARAGATAFETEQPGVEPDEQWGPTRELMADAEIASGIWAPVEQYACIDNALAAAEGLDVGTHLDRIAALWADFNTIAQGNPSAAFAAPRTAEFLRDAGPDNRPLAFPYAKWHSTQWAVDQGGALVLCSTAFAERVGIPQQRWVFPRVLVESSYSLSLTKRADLHRWPAMQVLGAAAAAHLGRALRDVDHTEVYSCFPAAVRVQQRELDLPLGEAPTVTGGMAFAGGPFNNFTYMATAAIVQRLRADRGSLGLVTTVSGLLTKAALAVWSTQPDPHGPLIADLHDEAAEATTEVDVTGEHHGDATVATWTVTYADGAPASAFVIADLHDGRRWIGTSSDPALLDAGVHDGLIGASVRVAGTTCVLSQR